MLYKVSVGKGGTMSDEEIKLLVWDCCVKEHKKRVQTELQLLERAIRIRERIRLCKEFGIKDTQEIPKIDLDFNELPNIDELKRA